MIALFCQLVPSKHLYIQCQHLHGTLFAPIFYIGSEYALFQQYFGEICIIFGAILDKSALCLVLFWTNLHYIIFGAILDKSTLYLVKILHHDFTNICAGANWDDFSEQHEHHYIQFPICQCQILNITKPMGNE